jgi:hypothetical protein
MNGRMNASVNGGRSRKAAKKAPSVQSQMALNTVLTRGPSDPPPVSYTIDVMYRTRLTLAPAGATDVAVTVNALTLTVPGGPTLWTNMRLEHVSVYAPADNVGYVRVRMADQTSGAALVLGDGRTFEDFGTQGALRPQIHLRPCLSIRNVWYDSASANELFYVNHGTSGQLLVYATLALRSKPRV